MALASFFLISPLLEFHLMLMSWKRFYKRFLQRKLYHPDFLLDLFGNLRLISWHPGYMTSFRPGGVPHHLTFHKLGKVLGLVGFLSQTNLPLNLTIWGCWGYKNHWAKPSSNWWLPRHCSILFCVFGLNSPISHTGLPEMHCWEPQLIVEMSDFCWRHSVGQYMQPLNLNQECHVWEEYNYFSISPGLLMHYLDQFFVMPSHVWSLPLNYRVFCWHGTLTQVITLTSTTPPGAYQWVVECVRDVALPHFCGPQLWFSC